MRNNNSISKRTTRIIALVLIAVICLVPSFKGSSAGAASSADDNYYFSDYKTKAEALQEGDEVNKQLVAEGITLLKNDSSLPLDKNAKVSVFGKRSVQLIYGGQGSGSGGGGVQLTITESLKRAGISANPDLASFYNNKSLSGEFGKVLKSYEVNAGLANMETPIDKYSTELESSYSNYSDAAFVVISRFGGEAVDLPKAMSSGFSGGNLKETAVDGARSYTDHYLQLDKNESDLIKYVGDRFDNVIILLNTGSQFEVSFLDDPTHYGYHKNVKGAMWIGYPGTKNGFESFGKIVVGDVNPSGKTVDTYARDFKKDPTWNNLLTHSNNAHFYSNSSFAFVDYKEGIYVGYRYYETRGVTDGEQWYKDNVVYPFGYGLSYTTFDWEFVSSNIDDAATLTEDGEIRLTVKVTNSGAVAGKDVVQLYYTAPYIDGEIEKSHVNLGGFEKTKLLQPGESQNLTVSIKVRDMASYDYSDANENEFKGYELDGGNYGIKLMRNSHDTVITKTYSVPSEGYKYRTDAKTGTEVKNQFDYSSNKIKNYMTRSDFAGTFPQAPTSEDRVMTEEIRKQTIEYNVSTEDASDPWYTDVMPTQKAGNVDGGDIMLRDMVGLERDDPKWEEFLNQFTVGDNTGKFGYTKMLLEGDMRLIGFNALGIPNMHLLDGPSGINDRQKGDYTNFACEVMTASTWNKEIAYRKGIAMGNEALFGGVTNGINRITGLFAPAVNIHRSPFSGRNYEYFSEDGYISGIMSAEIIKGCNKKGLITFIKHFAVNDQETARDKLHTWVDEQAMRELYFKPFEIAVKDGNTFGVMSALNAIGGVWTGGNYELLTNVLRKEWGFDGIVNTDYIALRGQLSYNQCIRAGGDIMLTRPDANRAEFTGLDSPTTVAAMRRAAKNVWYNIANRSMGLNLGAESIFSEYTATQLTPSPLFEQLNLSVSSAVLNNGGSVSDITYALKEGSTLPDGLTLTSSGDVVGTPIVKANNHSFTVVASYDTAKIEATFVLSVIDPNGSIIYNGKDDIATAFISKPYSENVATAYTSIGAETTVVTYAVSPYSLLPEGLTLSSDGEISGTPTKYCKDYSVEIVASADGFEDATQVFTLSVLDTFAFVASELKAAKFNIPYMANVAIAGFEGANYALDIESKLPSGLTLTSSGTIIGTPTEAVSEHKFTVVATKNGYQSQKAEYVISVGLSYPKFVLEDTLVGDEYEGYVNFAQGAGVVEYAVKSGSSLPDGLTLSKDGRISGTASKGGNFTFTIVSTADGKISDEVSVQLFVESLPEAASCGSVISSNNSLILIPIGTFVAGICLLTRKNKRRNSNEKV